jgi:hypothetical protein
LSFVYLSEFIIIGLCQNTSGYPFGSEGLVPWYYKTAEVYIYFNLFLGLLFLSAFIASLWAVAKRKELIILMIFLSTILFGLFMMYT